MLEKVFNLIGMNTMERRLEKEIPSNQLLLQEQLLKKGNNVIPYQIHLSDDAPLTVEFSPASVIEIAESTGQSATDLLETYIQEIRTHLLT